VSAAVVAALSIWGAITGFYGTRHWQASQICRASYMGDDFALVQANVKGRRHVVALHLYSKRRGWVVMWADGKVNPRIGPSTAPLVLSEVTRLKAKCLAP
jgi:hypothetical protein